MRIAYSGTKRIRKVTESLFPEGYRILKKFWIFNFSIQKNSISEINFRNYEFAESNIPDTGNTERR